MLQFILGGAFLTGCASQEVRTPKEVDRHTALSSEVGSDVPLPEHTPYDSNPELKALYLKGYAGGYRIGITGCAASCDIAGSKEHPERARAYIEGNLAGQDAGTIVWESKNEPNEAPDSTVSAGTSAAGQSRVPAPVASHL